VKKQVLFVQGAGQGAHEEDARLVASLGDQLGAGYEIRFPTMPNEDSPDDDVWSARLAEELATMGEGVAVVGHSAGAATLLMFLADKKPKQALTGIFLIGAPFFGEGGWDCGDFELPKNLSARLPEGVPVFLYHGRDDEIVPFGHVELYAKALPQAVVRRLDGRNHQLNDDLSEVASDIRLLV
jgi:predicted alpha/beta hydrolase family esterase